MRNLVSPLRILCAVAAPLAVLVAGAMPSQAQSQNLTFTLTPADRVGAPGSTITYTGVLANNNNFTMFIDTIGGTFTDPNAGDHLTVLPSGSLPTSIAANSFYSGDIFDLIIDSTATFPLSGTAVVYGGPTPGSFEAIGSQNFVVVPEASTATLIGSLVPFLGAGVVVLRRRKKMAA